jgi:ribosomal protein S18 acetylase RimI-like enzyme
MKEKNVKYFTKIASEEEIYLHLLECSNSFIPNLAETVDIKEYSNKIFLKSTTFEAWDNNKLVGLVAAYLNDFRNHVVFITNVSVTSEFLGMGIASQLLTMCFKHAAQNNFSRVLLEVNNTNIPAIKLYEKYGFSIDEKREKTLIMKLELANLNE